MTYNDHHNVTLAGVGRSCWAIVLAGGSGNRFGAVKQFAQLGGMSLLAHSVQAAAACCEGVVVVVPLGAVPQTEADLAQADLAQVDLARAGRSIDTRTVIVTGGASRAASVRCGLAAAPAEASVLVIADAAHPLAGVQLFERVIEPVLAGADGALPGLPLTEVIARVESGVRAGSIPREGHVLVQMPQAFRADLLRRAHAGEPDGVEDSAMVAALGGRVVVVEGDPANLHVTTPHELALAQALLLGR